MSLYLDYHPKTLQGVVGHDALVKNLLRILSKSTFEAFWLSGVSGCGKTSVAQCLANHMCGPMDVTQLAGTDCGVDAVEDVRRNFALSTWGPSGWKAIVINEAHKITDRAVDAWLCLLDPDQNGHLLRKRLVLFTSTEELGKDLFGASTGGLGRRCKSFTLKPDVDAFALYAKSVADGEELNGGHWPVESFVARVKHRKGSLGAVLQDIEAGVFMEAASVAAPVVQKNVVPEPVAAVVDADMVLEEIISGGACG